MDIPKKTWAKPFTIGGFVAGEVYMLFTALAPNLSGVAPPWEAMVQRCLGLAIFFGPFGAAVGMGVWLLGHALKQTFTKSAGPAEAPAETDRPA